MTKRVLDVGNCNPDHTAIRQLVEGSFDAQVDRVHQWQDARERLRSEHYDLVLVNRKLDIDYSDGLDIIQKIKADPELATVPVMLLTNYADHQQAAQDAGAELGFGKLEYDKPETGEQLAAFLR